MNPRIIFIDNFDSFTYNLVDALRVLGGEICVYRNRITPERVAGLIAAARDAGAQPLLVLSPGPGRPEDAGALLDIIRSQLGRCPMLGICLGHQALGLALGGRVVPAPAIVHGKTALVTHDGREAFRGLPQPLQVARYHSLVVTGLPDEVRVPARCGDLCMALAQPRLRVLGLQFHPESIMTTYGETLLRQCLLTLCPPAAAVAAPSA